MGERHSGHERVEADFYVEEPWASEALFEVERFAEPIWDPACGTGNIVKSALARGYEAYGSDLIDRGFSPMAEWDFLGGVRVGFRNRASIVTNPPFAHAQAFIEKALAFNVEKVAVLARLQFLGSIGRRKMFETTPLKRAWVLSSRVRIFPDGKFIGKNPSADHCWLVWERGYEGPPTIGWLSRPR